MPPDSNKEIIRRYYQEFWNGWRFDMAEELIDPDLTFRGSLGRTVAGRAGLVAYMKYVQAAFPDFFNSIEEMIAEEETVAVRLIYTGTHQGEIFGFAPSGRRIRYVGAGLFRLSAGRILEGWVLGDVPALLLQLQLEEK